MPLEVLQETRICIDCLGEKPLSDYHTWTNSAGRRGHLKFCRSCANIRLSEKRYESEESTLRFRQQCVKSLCKSKNMNFNLPEGYLFWLWEIQRGLCFYTDLEMIFGEYNNPSNLSVDKIVPGCGYVVGNVVLCSRRSNLVKNDMSLQEMSNWTPGWYSRLHDLFSANRNGTFPMALFLAQCPLPEFRR